MFFILEKSQANCSSVLSLSGKIDLTYRKSVCVLNFPQNKAQALCNLLTIRGSCSYEIVLIKKWYRYKIRCEIIIDEIPSPRALLSDTAWHQKCRYFRPWQQESTRVAQQEFSGVGNTFHSLCRSSDRYPLRFRNSVESKEDAKHRMPDKDLR